MIIPCRHTIAPVTTNVNVATPLMKPPSTTFNAFIACISVMPIAASMARFMMPMPPPKKPPYTATNNSNTEAPATDAWRDWCEMPAEILPVKCLPNANSSVAPNNNHGSTRRNVCAGVLISSTAPANPPTILVTISGIITRREIFKCLRYAPPLAVTPTHSASVFVAFAATGGTPLNLPAGNATKLPPPATALSAPPTAPAANRKMACGRFKLVFYHESAAALHRGRALLRLTAHVHGSIICCGQIYACSALCVSLQLLPHASAREFLVV